MLFTVLCIYILYIYISRMVISDGFRNVVALLPFTGQVNMNVSVCVCVCVCACACVRACVRV